MMIHKIATGMAFIKPEIKEEEAFDEFFDDEQFTDENLTHTVKIENDEAEYFDYDQPNEDAIHAQTSNPAVSTAKTKPIQNQIECENVFIDGEPEICITNLPNRSKEDASDPLALSTPPRKPSPCTQPKRFIIELKRAKKAPPVKDLVNRTYSSRHRNATKDRHHACKTCKRPFADIVSLQNHTRVCILNKNKCQHCNLIFQTFSYLVDHMKTCRVANGNSNEISTTLTPTERVRLSSTLGSSSRNACKSCNICYIKLGSEEQLAAHRKQSHFIANAYACHLCENKFDNERDALLHLQNAH